MIPVSTLNRIRDAVPLAAVVGETVDLKPIGASHVGLCPFHTENSASFYVRETHGTYHCFGCGASGDVFSFLMETRHIDFAGAVEILTARVHNDVGDNR